MTADEIEALVLELFMMDVTDTLGASEQMAERISQLDEDDQKAVLVAYGELCEKAVAMVDRCKVKVLQ
jgi:hypothetical protein